VTRVTKCEPSRSKHESKHDQIPEGSTKQGSCTSAKNNRNINERKTFHRHPSPFAGLSSLPVSCHDSPVEFRDMT
jgi:hypothetical protein